MDGAGAASGGAPSAAPSGAASAPTGYSPAAPIAVEEGGATDGVELVRESTARAAAKVTDVTIDHGALDALIDQLLKEGGGKVPDVSWSTGGFHYDGDAEAGGPLTAQYVFVVDCLNFCFWPTPGLEYEHLAGGIRDALLKDPSALSADALASVTEETLKAWVGNAEEGLTMPNLAERARKVRELGRVLKARWGGLAANMVAAARNNAPALVALVAAELPGFRDHAVYDGEQVWFYKRAQILTGDVWAAYGKRVPGTDGGEGEGGPWYALGDMDRLTMFADYRVPQVLRETGVLRYGDALAARVDERAELPAGGPEEVGIRAVTVVACEALRERLAARGVRVLSVEVDWLLWNWGEARRETLRPHHRTRTVFY